MKNFVSLLSLTCLILQTGITQRIFNSALTNGRLDSIPPADLGRETDNLEYPPQAIQEKSFGVVASNYSELSSSIDVLLKWNLKMCSTCESLKYFGIRFGPNSVSTLRYATVSSSCSGSINLLPPTAPSNRPGNDQLFLATQLQDETWLLEPRNCPGRYIKATSASTLAIVSGISSTARFWIEYHDDHVHLQSGAYSTYWGGVAPVVIGPGASKYMVEYWPARAWP